MITKTIHYCWFGRGELPEKAKQCIESWKKFCPDYEIKEWNEDNFDMNSCAYVKEAYEASTIARTTIAGAIINVLVNLALIRFIGLYAASISTLVSYASTALYRRIDIRKYIKIKVNVKNILLNSVAVVFVTLSYYFNITILNVAALVIACIYAVGINWKLIKMFFAEIRKYKKEGN